MSVCPVIFLFPVRFCPVIGSLAEAVSSGMGKCSKSCFIGWNKVFQGMKQCVSLFETDCFTAWNRVFQKENRMLKHFSMHPVHVSFEIWVKVLACSSIILSASCMTGCARLLLWRCLPLTLWARFAEKGKWRNKARWTKWVTRRWLWLAKGWPCFRGSCGYRFPDVCGSTANRRVGVSHGSRRWRKATERGW